MKSDAQQPNIEDLMAMAALTGVIAKFGNGVFASTGRTVVEEAYKIAGDMLKHKQKLAAQRGGAANDQD
ncbi:Uncharacterised protein [Serratia quinivorans]|uniref:hypothetical protein n=1 Tax=Serratia quinivorans TaxID=137545 RepID=UPI002178D23D|nr:hypothetical protein [Serratia quinivorans]CAI0710966.1 Uncharacterised protein [Serratia quinivorans]